MESFILKPCQEELNLCKKNYNIKQTAHANIDYNDSVCCKPWGHEFLIFSNNKLAIWYLKIKQGHSTSLHCHFNKDTLIIVLDGAARVGLYNNNNRIMRLLDSIYIPKYTFHSLSSFSEEVTLLEIEVFGNTTTFSDKNDLLRIQDNYIRPSIGYESSITIRRNNLEHYNFFKLQMVNEYTINNTTLSLKKITNDYDLSLLTSNYIILIDGLVNVNTNVLREGSILKPTEQHITFYDPITVLTLENNVCEDRKLIYSFEQLKMTSEHIKSRNKKIILTSGCFDIVHVGHIEFLRKAKEYGDILIVCLSSDLQIRALKGPSRPVNNNTDRINLFKIIKYVDYIIPYNEEFIETEGTLAKIMKIVDPDIWAKGGDYTEEYIRNKHPFLKDIKIIELVQGKSSTNIISSILNSKT
jgi:D-beta-D-heptose 7-phosphate kinase/D-beta-D-heptose 1-phosphate adenosyltransferase